MADYCGQPKMGKMNAYVFILCPPYSGSTILWNLVSTSDAVSSLPGEGQYIPEVEEVMRQAPWKASVALPWKRIKEVWEGYWDKEKPLLVEKSPPNLIRTNSILEHFSPVYFLIMVRNPYAHCEGPMRRNGWGVEKAAEFTVRCMRQQRENAEKLDHALSLTYEELVENPEATSQAIQASIPELGKLKHDQNFEVYSVDGMVKRGIVNLNEKKIRNLSVSELAEINRILKDSVDAMKFWGYDFIEPSLHHALKL